MHIKLKHEILEAIDQLRGRKARPDVERICNHVQRRYNVHPNDTIADLERLVDEEEVIRVEYKGSTSYRNVAKWPRYKIYKNKPDAANLIMMNSERTSSLLEKALNVLTLARPSYRITGVPYEEIQKYLVAESDIERFKGRNYLDTVIAREMNSGNFVMLENGNYVLDTRDLLADDDELKAENFNISPEEEIPKKLIKPWMVEHFRDDDNRQITMDAATNSFNSQLSPKSQKMVNILNICKSLRDADKKKFRKRDSGSVKNNGKVASATTTSSGAAGAGAATGAEGASPTAGKTNTPASRVGSRRKRARQVFDPSDNNLPRNRLHINKRGRPITGNAKQLQQHAAQHQMLRIRHQQQTATPPPLVPATPPAPTSPSPPPAPKPEEAEVEPPPSKRLKTPVKAKLSPRPAKSPSVSSAPVSPASTAVSTDDTGSCVVCKDDTSNKTFKLIGCQTCSQRVHAQCLKNLDDPTQQPSMRHALKWKCMQCRICVVCSARKDKDGEFMVVCSSCNEAFHASCHAPSLCRRPRYKWFCYSCAVKKSIALGQPVVTYGDKNSALSVPIKHVTTGGVTNGIDLEPNDDSLEAVGRLGEVVGWTCSDVAGYFTEKGFPDEAAVMKEQGVDGKTLLLMKRMDVLRGLKLKLGPALKIYTNHVLRMQQRHFSDNADS